MKNIIYKIKICILNHFFTLVLLFFLILSTFNNMSIQNKLDKYGNGIYGTYIKQGKSIDESEYFVFEKDKFYHYIQFKLLDKGDYNEVYENVYFLKGDNQINDFIIKGVMNDSEVIYFNNKNLNSINIYSKTSDIPTFINIEIKK